MSHAIQRRSWVLGVSIILWLAASLAATEPLDERASPQQVVALKPLDERASPRQVVAPKPLDERASPRQVVALKPLDERASPQQVVALKPLNVLLLVSDDQRPDTIGVLGNPHIRTPHLDSLAKRSRVMRRAICANPICTPSRAEILTGCSSFRNGVLDFGRTINPKIVTWPQAMHDAGYATWYVGKWHNNGRPALHGYAECNGLFAGGGAKWWTPQTDWRGQEVTGYRGWIFQSADGKTKYPDRGVGLTAEISRDFADAAIEVLKQSAGKQQPFFLHVNFTAPHDPLLIPKGKEYAYAPGDIPIPPNFLERHPFDHGNLEGRDERLLPWPRTPELIRKTLAAYYSVITHLDAQVGRILAALEENNLADNTLVIYTSDHGLAVGSHGLRGKQSMYEHTIGVPLLIAGPNIAAGESQAPIYLRDLYPTVCELAGVPLSKEGLTLDGVSHADVLRGLKQSHHQAVFGYFRQHQRMIRKGDWKLIVYPEAKRKQLFHLAADPNEIKDLASAPSHQPRLRMLETELSDWLATQRKEQSAPAKVKN